MRKKAVKSGEGDALVLSSKQEVKAEAVSTPAAPDSVPPEKPLEIPEVPEKIPSVPEKPKPEKPKDEGAPVVEAPVQAAQQAAESKPEDALPGIEEDEEDNKDSQKLTHHDREFWNDLVINQIMRFGPTWEKLRKMSLRDAAGWTIKAVLCAAGAYTVGVAIGGIFVFVGGTAAILYGAWSVQGMLMTVGKFISKPFEYLRSAGARLKNLRRK